MSNLTLPIQCFGAFRQFGDDLTITVNQGASVKNVKDALTKKLGIEHQTLINESALANDNEILSNNYIFDDETQLSILPPVCGG